MKFFFGALAVIAIGFGAYWYVAGQSGAGGAQIVFRGPESIFYGEPFELAVGVSNVSSGLWNGVGLSLALPSGFVFADGQGNPTFASRQLGDLGSGSLTETKFGVVAILPDAETGATSTDGVSADAITAQLSYSPAGAGATIEKKEAWPAPVSQSGIDMAIAAPEKVAAGEEFKLKISYANAAPDDMDGLSLRVAYPSGFAFTKATSDPDAQGDMGGVWNIGSLAKGSSDALAVFGRMKDATSTVFAATVFRTISGRKQPIAKAQAGIEAGRPPVTVQIDANDTPDYVVHLGDTVTYTVSYVLDGVPAPKGGVAVTAAPSSPLFDLSSIVPMNGGVVRRGVSGGTEVAWTVSGGDEGGSVSFSIKAKSAYDIRRLGDRDFTAKLHAEAKAGATVGIADLESKIAGQIDIGAKAYFRDADSGILNAGSVPPKAGVVTQYTVHWTIRNHATDMTGIAVRAPLAPGVKCTGTVKSSVDAKPVCDPVKNEATWNIPRMSATTGAIGRAPEAIFQISAVPTADMVGKFMPLMGAVTLTATDAFTTTTVSSAGPEITTALPDDASVGPLGLVVR